MKMQKWTILKYVSDRYGKIEGVINEAARKLEMVKKKEMPFLSLEENTERIENRMARESGSFDIALERIINAVDFKDTYIIDLIAHKCRSVCRILKGKYPIGTGFLLTGNIIITNHHVIGTPGAAADMYAEFDYELDHKGNAKSSSIFKLDAKRFFLTSGIEADPAIPYSGLDFTFIGVDDTNSDGRSISGIPTVVIDGNLGKIIKGESCAIVQHPEGMLKKIVLENTHFFSETKTRIVYEADTLPGSSGSMVIGLGTGEVVALHHAGLPRTDGQNRPLKKDGTVATVDSREDEIDWLGNEGIKISCIVDALKNASLPVEMEQIRGQLLGKTEKVAEKLQQAQKNSDTLNNITAHTDNFKNKAMANSISDPNKGKTDLLLTAINNRATIGQIETALSARYGTFELLLAMPASATENELELFSLQIPYREKPEEEIKELLLMPGVKNAEVDTPLALNVPSQRTAQFQATESALVGDGYGEQNEEEFLKKYAGISGYIKKGNEHHLNNRRWNWQATNFTDDAVSPAAAGIRIVQFDTGFSDHSKVVGGFDVDNDRNFVDNDSSNAWDPGAIGILKQPRHGTRTGSLLIGNAETIIPENGNCGLLSKHKYKLTPYRIAESVILINRQKQLAAALDTAISQGYDIITMSMGLPPTLATAKMARKAYDKGVIWCCAAGNEVQAVIAPAVYPGTIAVAASNPLDADWPASSRGDAVDITAPGQDVYVPILYKDKKDGNKIKEGFAYGDGTSYATPHIAAAAAYWLAEYKDVLNDKAYAGWRRVEAFRQALRDSARDSKELPSWGFGAGILNFKELMKQKPKPANKLVDAYDGWNESAFFDTLQGYADMAKTYWNRLHGLVFGTKKGNQESIGGIDALSETSMKLEAAMFGNNAGNYESMESGSVNTLERFNHIQNLIESSAKTK